MGRGGVRAAHGSHRRDQLSLLGLLSLLVQLRRPTPQLPHRGERTTAASQARAARRGFRYRIGIPDRVRAMTSRWISLVPSKMV